jgi:hypothetical protein
MIGMLLARSLPRFCVAGWLVLFMLAVPLRVDAQVRAAEADLKAAIITNMLLFVEWPTRESSPVGSLTICYLGDSPVATALLRLDGKAVKGMSLKVVPLIFSGAEKCHALYLSPANLASLAKTMGWIGSSSIFLAADSPEYLRRGVMLNLEESSGRIVFDVDLGSVHKAGFQVSSKALRLARQVIE